MTAAAQSLSLDEVYRTQHRRVYSLCLRMLRNEAEAEDLTQEVFLQLHRKLHLFRGESSLSTWVHSVTVNQVLMFMRKRKKLRERECAIDDEPDGGDVWINTLPAPARSPHTKMMLEAALEQMPDGYRNVLLLHDYHGFEHHEVGAILGFSAGTSKSQLHKARIKMQQLLQRKANPRVWFKPAEFKEINMSDLSEMQYRQDEIAQVRSGEFHRRGRRAGKEITADALRSAIDGGATTIAQITAALGMGQPAFSRKLRLNPQLKAIWDARPKASRQRTELQTVAPSLSSVERKTEVTSTVTSTAMLDGRIVARFEGNYFELSRDQRAILNDIADLIERFDQ